MNTSSNFMHQILNLNVKNFIIPKRRGTTVNGMENMKRFSAMGESMLPSETDLKAINGNESYIPPSELEPSKFELKILPISHSNSKSEPSVSSSSSSSSSDSKPSVISLSKVSCNFVINIQEEKTIPLEEEDKSEIDILQPPMIKINNHPDLSNEESSQNSEASSHLTTYSSTSSKVSVKENFLRIVDPQEQNMNISQSHRRRSNITMIKVIDPDMEDKTTKRRHSKNIPSKSRLHKSFANRKSFQKKKRPSNVKMKGVKSSYRSFFRCKKSIRGSKVNNSRDKKLREKKPSKQLEMSRRKTIMCKSTENFKHELNQSLKRKKTQDIFGISEKMFVPLPIKNAESRFGGISDFGEKFDQLDEIAGLIHKKSTIDSKCAQMDAKLKQYALMSPIVQNHERTPSFISKLPGDLRRSLLNGSENNSNKSKTNFLGIKASLKNGAAIKEEESKEKESIMLSVKGSDMNSNSMSSRWSDEGNNISEGKQIKIKDKIELFTPIIQLKPVAECTENENHQENSSLFKNTVASDNCTSKIMSLKEIESNNLNRTKTDSPTKLIHKVVLFRDKPTKVQLGKNVIRKQRKHCKTRSRFVNALHKMQTEQLKFTSISPDAVHKPLLTQMEKRIKSIERSTDAMLQKSSITKEQIMKKPILKMNTK